MFCNKFQIGQSVSITGGGFDGLLGEITVIGANRADLDGSIIYGVQCGDILYFVEEYELSLVNLKEKSPSILHGSYVAPNSSRKTVYAT